MMLGKIATEMDIPEALSQLEIAGITSDSRKVRPGYIFAALKGVESDGRRYIPDAAASGASVVLTSKSGSKVRSEIPVLQVADPRRSFALIAAKLAGNQPENIVAVTGTSGKTSVADFARQIFAFAGLKSASVGTIGTVSPSGTYSSNLTTLDPVDLHEELARLASEGVTHAAIEASSHGLDQRRIDGVRLKACAFTNLGRDHLDYHKTAENYLNAKLRLFECLLLEGGTAVYDPMFAYTEKVREICDRRGLRTVTVGERGDRICLNSVVEDGSGQILSLTLSGRNFKVKLPLLGAFQVSNALISMGLALAVGVEETTTVAALEELCGVPGRLQLVGRTKQGARIFIDYAHKPEALETVLQTLRKYSEGKLVCVIGAGGDRDTGKRPLLGSAASQHADAVIVTDDNPRSEDPQEIRKDILKGAPGAREIADRAAAIHEAIAMLGSGDVLCIAGKGHETGQILGNKVLPFSDHEVVGELLSKGVLH